MYRTYAECPYGVHKLISAMGGDRAWGCKKTQKWPEKWQEKAWGHTLVGNTKERVGLSCRGREGAMETMYLGGVDMRVET